VGTVEGMFGFPSSELRACVRRSPDTEGETAPDRTVGLQLRSNPLEQHGRIWQWVVDLNPGLPTLTDVLVNCYDFLVDDDCGREVGVVERVDMEPDSAVPGRLQVVQGWGRHRTMVSVDDVIEVAPGERRLVIACRAGHREPLVESARQGQAGRPIRAGGSGRWWLCWPVAEPSGCDASESCNAEHWSGFDEAAADGVAGQLDPVTHAELVEDVGTVPVDGLDADGEDGGDLLGAVSFGDKFDDLRLAGGEDVVCSRGPVRRESGSSARGWSLQMGRGSSRLRWRRGRR
jgi:hypothetical protein